MLKTLSLSLLLICINLGLHAQENYFDAIRNDHLQRVQKIITQYPDSINTVNENGHTGLILACYHGHEDIVSLLLANKADPNFSFSQGTALHGAAYKGQAKIVELLVKAGAKINIPDENGTTPLIYATLFQHIKIAQFLFAHGGDPMMKDNTGSSAFDYANDLKIDILIDLYKTK